MNRRTGITTDPWLSAVHSPCGRHTQALGWSIDRLSVPGIIVKHSLRYSPAIVVFAGLAIVAAGCSDARLAANNAASSSGQVQQQVQQSSYQVGYGLSSEG